MKKTAPNGIPDGRDNCPTVANSNQAYTDRDGVGDACDTQPPADTTPPILHVPSDQTVEAQGPNGATVTYTATATDNVDGSITPTCTPVSGSLFPLGTTAVNCKATDAVGNEADGSFQVTVADTKAPTHVLITSAVDKHGRPVSNGATIASKSITLQLSIPTDVVGVTGTGCSLDGGTPTSCTGTVSYSALRPGSHTLVYIATDAARNQACATFSWLIPLDSQ